MIPNNQKIHTLIIDEEMARTELYKNIDGLLKDVELRELGPLETENILLGFQDYMAGVKELTDLLKEAEVITRDTEPHHMPFDLEKAPDTKRCT